MSRDIYDEFEKATAALNAYAILWKGKPVGRVVLRHKTQCTAYVQVWGLPMAKGWARGGGYDRASAAWESATSRIKADSTESRHVDLEAEQHLARWRDTIRNGHSGTRWTQRLEDAGYVVQHVI